MELNNESVEILNADSKNELSSAGSWAKILGYCGLVFAGFIILMSILTLLASTWITKFFASPSFEGESIGKGILFFYFIIYFFIGIIWGYVSWQILYFGKEVKKGLFSNSSEILASAFKRLKIFLAAYAILSLISTFFMAIGLFVMLFIGFFNFPTSSSGTFG